MHHGPSFWYTQNVLIIPVCKTVYRYRYEYRSQSPVIAPPQPSRYLVAPRPRATVPPPCSLHGPCCRKTSGCRLGLPWWTAAPQCRHAAVRRWTARPGRYNPTWCSARPSTSTRTIRWWTPWARARTASFGELLLCMIVCSSLLRPVLPALPHFAFVALSPAQRHSPTVHAAPRRHDLRAVVLLLRPPVPIDAARQRMRTQGTWWQLRRSPMRSSTTRSRSGRFVKSRS